MILAENISKIESFKEESNSINVGFLLLDNFSMMSYTAAVDVLVTANLIQKKTKFLDYSFALKNNIVNSDLGIQIATSGDVLELRRNSGVKIDYIIVCGGLRAPLEHNKKLIQLLKIIAENNIKLGSIWNGVIPLAQAGLLKDKTCALHLNNHPFMQEYFPDITISDNSFIQGENHLSCADALGALNMMLKFVEAIESADVSKTVKEILNCNRSKNSPGEKMLKNGDIESLPENLRDAVQFMSSNIDEPISIDEISQYLGIHRRQLERLFKLYLQTSPSKYYLEVRLSYAKKLLSQTNESILNIAIASGFVNGNHFSNCFGRCYNISPSRYRNLNRYDC